MLAPMFEEVVALDLTEQMLEKAKVFIKQNGHENVSFVAGNAENLPFAAHFLIQLHAGLQPIILRVRLNLFMK